MFSTRTDPVGCFLVMCTTSPGFSVGGSEKQSPIAYRGGKLTQVTTKDGLFDHLIQQILEDDQGTLWMTCNKGIFRASKRVLNEFADGKAQRISCVSYGTADGMKSAECNGGSQPSCLKTPAGRLWFPTIAGAVVIDPAHVPINKLPPPVVLEDLFVDKKQLVRAAGGPQIVLPPGKVKFEFHHTALSFLVPQRVKFKYRLEGVDDDWVDACTERTAHYTNLPPRARERLMADCSPLVAMRLADSISARNRRNPPHRRPPL